MSFANLDFMNIDLVIDAVNECFRSNCVFFYFYYFAFAHVNVYKMILFPGCIFLSQLINSLVLDRIYK